MLILVPTKSKVRLGMTHSEAFAILKSSRLCNRIKTCEWSSKWHNNSVYTGCRVVTTRLSW